MTCTIAEENYIKAIYHLQHSHEKVGTVVLAESMQTKPASTTDMLKKLETKKLVHYEKYRGVELTEQGHRKAIAIVRKHRLWEFFLVNKLGFDWDAVHVLAEELEHISSDELTNRLDEYLGNPSFDPHGDPIPDCKVKIKPRREISLNTLPLKKIFVVSSVKNQSMEMLELLRHFHIGIGTKLKVNKRFPFDGSVEIKIDKSPATTISALVAKNVFCSV